MRYLTGGSLVSMLVLMSMLTTAAFATESDYATTENVPSTTMASTAAEGRGHMKKMMMNPYMLIPQLIALGFAPIVLANLKMMVMSALMVNNMAMNAAIFMTIRNLVFGPRNTKVKYYNYGYKHPPNDHHHGADHHHSHHFKQEPPQQVQHEYNGPPHDGPPNNGPLYESPQYESPQYDSPLYDSPPHHGPPHHGPPQHDHPYHRRIQYDQSQQDQLQEYQPQEEQPQDEQSLWPSRENEETFDRRKRTVITS